MRRLLLLAACLLPTVAFGQQAPETPGGLVRDPSLRVDSALRWLEQSVRAGSDRFLEARRRNLLQRQDGRVLVEVISRAREPRVTDARLRALGALPTHAVHDRVNVWVLPDRIEALARALPGVRLAEVPAEADATGSPGGAGLAGDGLTGADTYIAGGDDGTGIGIAIIDTKFGDLDLYAANGWVPSSWVERDFHPDVDFDDQDGTGDRHGTVCFQSAGINAPGATYYLYLFDSTTTVTTAVLDDIANDPSIDIVSYSFADFNEGWGDNSGNTNEGVAQVTAAGKLFFCASGNYAQQHWQGSFSDPDADDWHSWSGNDEYAHITISDDSKLTGSMSWDQSLGTPDYDLYLFDSMDNLLASSVDVSDGDVGDFESFTWTNTSGSDMTVFLAVHYVDGFKAEFEVFANAGSSNETFEYPMPASSIVAPTNSTEPNCISVGAVEDDDYADPSPAATNYSSRGPTKGGAIRPDFTGPTGTLYGGGGSFVGTSASCPNVAGAAAALWSSAPYLDATGVRLLLVRQAQIFKDWGPAGKDNTFGQGGVFLAPWAWGTRWVDRIYGDEMGVPHRPYKYVGDARDAAPEGGRLAILGGSYPEAITIDKELLVVTVGPLVILGD